MSPRVRIAHLSDPHIEIPPERVRPGTWERLLRDRDTVNDLAVDVVVITGDLTTFGSSDVSHLEKAREWLAGFTAPTMVIPGNHDLGPSAARAAVNPEMEAFEAVPFVSTRFASTMRVEALQIRDLGCARMIGVSLREDDPDEVLAALADAMATDTRPAVICGHYPIADPRPGYEAPEFGSGDFVPRASRSLRTLIDEAPNPVLFLCGHVHVNSLVSLSDRHHQLTAGGLGPGSSSFRVLEIDDRQVSYSTHLGSGPPLAWAYPDGTHSAEFSLGSAIERAGRIGWGR